MADYDIELMIKVAELYYLDDVPQREIAQKLNLSRPKVSRLLKAAKEHNLIDIKINYPEPARSELEKAFESNFGLKEAVIVSNVNENHFRTFAQVTATAAKYLRRMVKERDSIGVAWGRTLRAVVDSIGITERKNVRAVQIIGSLGQSSESANEIVRKMAESFGGNSFILPAPAIVDSPEIKDAIIKDNTIQDILNMARSVNIALVGIGNIDKNSSFFNTGYLKQKDLEALKQEKAVGDICAHFFDIEGRLCTDIDRRVIAISTEDLKKIPRVIGVATGKEKVKSILGALKSGILDVLITDEKTAKSIIDLSKP
ncbi:sugar-binding transcriptional regulator [Biomaibacter acetigenes]|uniref:Sugar-binding transcriptional regulator n=1 Tax=Biomaibacter acetigenes TaxID=2316383 RepID=A0A3G2R685_9FIRM|nr:sugar-binding transcriptional regulator [Biomaibacter acetigenes]AYO30875.1 sugar-binding transcriptional regulator [Biomaibacter acetigenes]